MKELKKEINELNKALKKGMGGSTKPNKYKLTNEYRIQLLEDKVDSLEYFIEKILIEMIGEENGD
jgi:hypothetical protein